jgi:acetyl esterase/lipase
MKRFVSSTALALAIAACSDQSVTGVAGRDVSAPLLDVAPGVLATTNISYARRSPTQKLDIHLPTTGKKPYPVVLWIHGGGWSTGSKYLDPTSSTLALLAHGIAVVSIDYRLSTEAKWPAQIHDVKAALRWVRANAGTYGLDQNRIGAWGSSAGGHLAAMLGTSNGVAAMTDLTLGNPTMSEKVKAVTDWFGPVAFLSMDAQLSASGCPLYRGYGHASALSPASRLVGAAIGLVPTIVHSANPAQYATVDDPQFFIVHGMADCVVPYQQSQGLAARLNRVRPGSATVQLLAGAIHGGKTFALPSNVGMVTSFFKRTL